ERGGWEDEIDIVAFHPESNRLKQIECSLDAESWAHREERYRKKFEAGRKYIPGLFKGLKVPDTIEQEAVFVFAATTNWTKLAGGTIVLLPDLLQEMLSELATQSIYKSMVDEQKPLLRTLQFVAQYRNRLFQAG